MSIAQTTLYAPSSQDLTETTLFTQMSRILKVTPDPNNIVQFIENLKKKIKEECDILCGYEAGCLGFSLYHELAKKEIRCVILAPTTMMTQQGKRVKTDKRDIL